MEKKQTWNIVYWAIALMLLAPQIPLLFMGEEEGSETPFLFFTDFHDELADAVREGRRREFVKFAAFADPQTRERIPDPNAPATFEASHPLPGPDALAWRAFYQDLLRLRRERVVPHLADASTIGAEAVGAAGVTARWRLGNGARLTITADFSDTPGAASPPSATAPIFSTDDRFAAWIE